ncbi:MAG TPA: CRTAC1 family protein, partial [Chthonomonadaceae bacterium]|nr:CRTAC1 family protein [Chthonomonadaceae bacterium]
PAHATNAPVRFHDVAPAAGLTYRWGHSSQAGLNILQTIGHGCAFLDYDGDGKLDILLVGSDHCLLYRNKGDGTFEDVTDRAFPNAPRRYELLGCAVADYDGDGRPDIFVTGYGRTILYHNEGDGTFKDVTAGTGLEARGPYDWTTSAAWADVDGDGRPDLYVCRYVRFSPDRPQLCPWRALDGTNVMMACGPETYPSEKGSLYHNEGGGHFHDVTVASGLATAHGNALACMFCDFNGDGKPDLYVANDQQPGDLFVNVGHGKFVNRGIEAGVAYNANGALPSGMGVDWGDYDGDGRFDLLVADFTSKPKSLYHNDGDTRFSQMSYPSGLGGATVQPLAFGAVFVDASNDGRLDIALTNGHVLSEIQKTDPAQTYAQTTQFFYNLGGGRFQEISAGAGPDFSRKIVGRGIAVGDYDGDGREDLLLVDDEGAPLLLHNDSPPGNHWISLRCLWRPGGSDAVGARVTLQVGGRKQIAEVRAGGSYLSTNTPDVHFGLGASTKIDRIQIRWPDGRVSQFTNLMADRAYHVSPGERRIE